jgi:hypothetical protein
MTNRFRILNPLLSTFWNAAGGTYYWHSVGQNGDHFVSNKVWRLIFCNYGFSQGYTLFGNLQGHRPKLGAEVTLDEK